MSTFSAYIEEVIDAPIEAVVIGPFGWSYGDEFDSDHPPYGHTDEHTAASLRQGEILTWEEARPLLDYPYNSGYGAPECHAVRIWSADDVWWITQYDGSTRLDSAPRHPVAHLPDMPGG